MSWASLSRCLSALISWTRTCGHSASLVSRLPPHTSNAGLIDVAGIKAPTWTIRVSSGTTLVIALCVNLRPPARDEPGYPLSVVTHRWLTPLVRSFVRVADRTASRVGFDIAAVGEEVHAELDLDQGPVDPARFATYGDLVIVPPQQAKHLTGFALARLPSGYVVAGQALQLIPNLVE